MKRTTAILLLSAPLLHAGSQAGPISTAPAGGGDWLKPLVDIRARYEYADIDAFDVSQAFTTRERIGFKTTAWNGLSLLIEGEFTQALMDDYDGGAKQANPVDAANSGIFDPETNELNQAYLQYEGMGNVVRFGRQRIIYDNAAFIGNVGWRQNEQTYDGVSLTNKSIPGLTLNAAWIGQVNRIFGSDSDDVLTPTYSNVQDIQSQIQLVNLSYTGIKGWTLGSYAYIMNFENYSAWDNNTFGASAKTTVGGVTLYGELAWQDKASTTGEEEACYYHATASRDVVPGKAACGNVIVGVEHLDAGFKTPLATVHAFNGFADVTDKARINGSHNGLTDVYVGHTVPVFYGMKWSNTLHAMGDNEISTGYGWEIDSVLTKKFDDHFTALAKLAWFESEGDAYAGATTLADALRFSV
ncbi:MAG TPA: alginate export family protein, partial [Luteolibacter sp.]|nr:alginate export family protein [Luteolibacter sp.]